MNADQRARVRAALELMNRVPGYEPVAADVERRLASGRVRFDRGMEDRGVAGLSGRIYLGREALYSSPLSLAETLVHEHYHLRHQFPLEKTASFWSGVFTGTPVMRRFERPAYRASADFLRAAAAALPEWAEAARHEAAAVAATYAAEYGESLIV